MATSALNVALCWREILTLCFGVETAAQNLRYEQRSLKQSSTTTIKPTKGLGLLTIPWLSLGDSDEVASQPWRHSLVSRDRELTVHHRRKNERLLLLQVTSHQGGGYDIYYTTTCKVQSWCIVLKTVDGCQQTFPTPFVCLRLNPDDKKIKKKEELIVIDTLLEEGLNDGDPLHLCLDKTLILNSGHRYQDSTTLDSVVLFTSVVTILCVAADDRATTGTNAIVVELSEENMADRWVWRTCAQ